MTFLLSRCIIAAFNDAELMKEFGQLATNNLNLFMRSVRLYDKQRFPFNTEDVSQTIHYNIADYYSSPGRSTLTDQQTTLTPQQQTMPTNQHSSNLVQTLPTNQHNSNPVQTQPTNQHNSNPVQTLPVQLSSASGLQNPSNQIFSNLNQNPQIERLQERLAREQAARELAARERTGNQEEQRDSNGESSFLNGLRSTILGKSS